MADAALDSRLSNRRQRTQGSEFRPLGHLLHHRRSRLATDKVLRNDRHLQRILRKYLEYYHGSRTHLALSKDAPEFRTSESPDGGKVIALPMVGGLHHRYTRRAA